jgi:hypothetical protein
MHENKACQHASTATLPHQYIESNMAVWDKPTHHTQSTIGKQPKPKTEPFFKLAVWCGNFSAHTHTKKTNQKRPRRTTTTEKSGLLFPRRRKTPHQKISSFNKHSSADKQKRGYSSAPYPCSILPWTFLYSSTC